MMGKHYTITYNLDKKYIRNPYLLVIHSQREHTKINKIPKFGVNQASFD